MDDLIASMKISASGMRAQGTRIRVVSENIANVDSLPTRPGDAPYQRKTILFKNELDKQLGADLVRVDKIGLDKSDFRKSYNPGHPAADDEGYVLSPNVNSLIETMDMREAQRSYEANLNVIRASRQMLQSTIDLLR